MEGRFLSTLLGGVSSISSVEGAIARGAATTYEQITAYALATFERSL
jgi:hypothetical protein